VRKKATLLLAVLHPVGTELFDDPAIPIVQVMDLSHEIPDEENPTNPVGTFGW
jgi:hypothetical protein